MKRLLLLGTILSFFGFSASAQLSAVQRVFKNYHQTGSRTEIVLPQVNGYNLYKADLHTHTIYSDGEMAPELRVREAWQDGLDIIAITDHMEYRRIERAMLQYMKGYIRPELREEVKAVNANLMAKAPDSRGILADFNVGYKMAAKVGKQLGVLVIRGVEITRGKLGDYNALFTTDNNAIYDPSLEQTIRNARKQGAFISHNHPQFSEETKSTLPPHCEDLHAKGLIDGIEIANGPKQYARLYSMCIDGGYAPIATSDVHYLISTRFPGAGKDYFRNMTLILAKKCDEKSIKEALNAKRTIAYSCNMLIGKEELLCDLLKASIEVMPLSVKGKKQQVLVTNKTSLPFALRWENDNESALFGLSSVIIEVKKGQKEIVFDVDNMLCGNEKSPKVSFKLQ